MIGRFHREILNNQVFQCMAEKRKLNSTEIIGRKIKCVYYENLPMDGRFQPRHIYICLETNVIFDVGSIVYPDEKQPLEIITSDFKSTFVPSLSAETNENLDSPIKALISSDEFFLMEVFC
jgi:hypothetical protein